LIGDRLYRRGSNQQQPAGTAGAWVNSGPGVRSFYNILALNNKARDESAKYYLFSLDNLPPFVLSWGSEEGKIENSHVRRENFNFP
jgi:hypothetical protein